MFVEVRVLKRRATAGGADDILEGLSDGYVLASNLVVLCPKCTIVCPFMLSLNNYSTYKDLMNRVEKRGEKNGETFIWVLRFWNQNLIWRGANPSSLLNCNLCFSSGCGHSLNILHSPNKQTNKQTKNKQTNKQ